MYLHFLISIIGDTLNVGEFRTHQMVDEMSPLLHGCNSYPKSPHSMSLTPPLPLISLPLGIIALLQGKLLAIRDPRHKMSLNLKVSTIYILFSQ